MYIRIQWFFCKFNNISFNKYIYILNISVFNYIETNIFSSKINLLFNILSNSIISWIVIYILFLNTFHVWCLRFFSFMLCLRLKCFYIRSTYFDIFRLIQNHKHIPSLIRLDNRNITTQGVIILSIFDVFRRIILSLSAWFIYYIICKFITIYSIYIYIIHNYLFHSIYVIINIYLLL